MKKTIFFIFTILYISKTLGQNNDSTVKPSLYNLMFTDTTPKDINDVIRHVFGRKKTDTTIKNKVVKNTQMAFLYTPGYSLQTGFNVVVAGNIAFSTNRLDKAQKKSSVFVGLTYSLSNQIILPFVANIWTKKNKYNVILDNRLIQYPDYVFGIGDATSQTKKYTSFVTMLRMHESLLREVKPNVYLGLGIMHDNIWNITGFDSIYKVINPASNKIITREIATGYALRFLFDNRLNQLNAKKGFYSNIIFRDNLTAFGSDANWGYLTTDTRAYIPFPRKSKNILAFWNYNMITFGGTNVSNYLLPSNGWDDTHNTGRGYIQGRFRGQHLFALEAEYRFTLTKNGLLGGAVFGNFQHYQKQFFYNSGFIKPAAGLGMRIKFNKHSDANFCVDYGWGQDGSSGFFLNIGEVF